jgi:hypothetical protein
MPVQQQRWDRGDALSRMLDDNRITQARAASIESELARRGIRLKRQGRELVGPCPRCGGTDRFAVNIRKQVWNCRHCKPDGIAGDIIGLVMWLDDVGFMLAVETLTGQKRTSRRTYAHSQPVTYE